MNKKLLIGIVVVLLLSVVGYSFAFITTNITGEGQENIVTATTLQLVYKDGQEVKLSNEALVESNTDGSYNNPYIILN